MFVEGHLQLMMHSLGIFQLDKKRSEVAVTYASPPRAMPASTPYPNVPSTFFLYSQPRTRSNLLVRLLETHPRMKSMHYPFMFAFLNGPESQWPADQQAQRIKGLGMTPEEHAKKWEKATYQAALDSMEKMMAKTKEEVRE